MQAVTQPLSLETPLSDCSGANARLAAQLKRLGLISVQDALLHLPNRYQDRTQITPIQALTLGQQAVVDAYVVRTQKISGRRPSFIAYLHDASSEQDPQMPPLQIRFFHQAAYLQHHFKLQQRVLCFGEVRLAYQGIGWEMAHPDYQCLEAHAPLIADPYLTPIYASTEGLHQGRLRRLLASLLQQVPAHAWPSLQHPWPTELATPCRYTGLRVRDLSPWQALCLLHQMPPAYYQAELLANRQHPAQIRLAIDELLAHQGALQGLRRRLQSLGAPVFNADPQQDAAFLAQLPFQPTQAQHRVVAEIRQDLQQSRPMLRLLQGDVGSGKTLVAAMAALAAVASGYQVALMAPTELLAEQHAHNFRQWCTPLNIQVALLTGKGRNKARQVTLAQLAAGEIHIAIGTHALFQTDVAFDNLGLVIIDEQHRFGVHQRLALRNKSQQHTAHQLIMTATPIPRTLAMCAYADLDVSILDELPPGRQGIQTVTLADTRKAEVIARVAAACQAQRQVYWVCTLIEESDVLSAQAAEQTYVELTQALTGLRVGLVHGRLQTKQKHAVMQAFKAGDLDVLVATTVIEVGVDVPNASVMVIENPERLGLAQLHQLRGRVGRGSQQSFCVLLYGTPLSDASKARLQAMRTSQDGFWLAQKDLELRGPGEVLGTRQTGLANMRVAELNQHAALIPWVHQIASQLPQSQLNLVIETWLQEATHYGEV